MSTPSPPAPGPTGASALVAAQQRVLELVEQAAQVYVEMFRSTVWQDFVDAGLPEDGWPGIQAVVEGLEPVASAALPASFRSAMAAAVAQEVDSQLGSGTGARFDTP